VFFLPGAFAHVLIPRDPFALSAIAAGVTRSRMR